MAIKRRISLRSHEDAIRRWASEGRSDAWIAGALGTSAGYVQSFRSRKRIPAGPRRGRRGDPAPNHAGPRYEGVVERGPEGRVGLWMDAAISGDPVYRERWAGRRKVRVRVSGSRIVVVAATAGAV